MQIPVIGLDRIVFAGGTRQFDLFIISQSGASIVMVNLTAPMIARSGARVPAVPSALDNGRRSPQAPKGWGHRSPRPEAPNVEH
jgi:hypothetical protein